MHGGGKWEHGTQTFRAKVEVKPELPAARFEGLNTHDMPATAEGAPRSATTPGGMGRARPPQGTARRCPQAGHTPAATLPLTPHGEGAKGLEVRAAAGSSRRAGAPGCPWDVRLLREP